MNLQHTFTKQKNFISAPAESKEEIINRPIQLQYESGKQTLLAASGTDDKTE